MATPEHLPTDFIRSLTARLTSDARVEYLWLEGPDDSIQWPPYEPLDLHLGVPEPFVDAVRGELAEVFDACCPGGVSDFSQQDAPLKGFAGSAVLSDGTPLRYRVERTSQIAKVPRKAVNVLLDRSGGLLLPALDFE